MPYLTPDELPEGRDCRALLIPASSDWLAIVSGALTELTKAWNWEQQGSVTVEQAIAAMETMIDAYYEGCNDCELPWGGDIIRINQYGIIEVLQNGEWVEPTEGDYYIPPPDEREGGTEEEQICLASKNAANALHELYSNLSESFTEELTAAQALVAMTAFATGLIGFAFAPITAWFAGIIFAAFELLYSALSYLTADLWTEDFESQITCFLIECATNTAGVVTFDWQCWENKLNSLANEFSLDEVQLRLYLQIGFILQFIGGAGALNLAGATTAVTNDDCSFCDPQLELEPVPGFGFGEVEKIGDFRFRVTSTPADGSHKSFIRVVNGYPDNCTFTFWYDPNEVDFPLGSLDTEDWRNEFCTAVFFAPTEINPASAWFAQSSNAFIMEFDAFPGDS